MSAQVAPGDALKSIQHTLTVPRAIENAFALFTDGLTT